MKADYQVHIYRNNIVLSRQTDCGWYTFSRHLDTLLGKTTWQKSLETNQWFSLWWQMTIRIACWLLVTMIFLNDRMVFFLKAVTGGNTIVALILALFFPVSTLAYYLLSLLLHSSEIWGLCLMKSPSEMLQNLPYFGPDHVQVFWKHKSVGNQASDWLTC